MASLPSYQAQLATLSEQAPSGERWLHELKYDGYRIACEMDGTRVRLLSRRDRDWTESFPELVAAVKSIGAKDALLDGEVALVTPDGRTSFQALQNAFAGGTREGLTYFVFDLLFLNGRDLRALPLEARKAECERLLGDLPDASPLKYSRHFDVDGPTLLEKACALGAEGIVSKRRDKPYHPGRNQDWLKTKCVKRQELVLGGFTDPEGMRDGIGALLVGYYEDGALRFGGKVGTGPGFTAKYLNELRRELERHEQQACPFEPRLPGWLGRNAHFLEPVLTGEVVFTEWTAGGHIRHGSFQGLRRDKPARSVIRELPARTNDRPERDRAEPPPATKKGRTAAAKATTSVLGVTITSPERLVYPSHGFSKLDLAELYADLAEVLLPYIANRPLTLVRCEKGVRKEDALRSECKFLKHQAGFHRWAHAPIRRLQIQEQKKVGEYLVVDSQEGLIALIQGDIIELHVWNATSANIERPDRIVFDLDPGAEVPWPRVLAAARLLRKELERLGLECWVKLTGGKGLHVVLPFAPEQDWATVYAFSRSVAERIERQDPASFTLEFAKAGRERKILIDYKRNHRAAVAIAAYSTRAHPSAALSVPVAWRELTASLSPQRFTVENVRARVKDKPDPWRDFWTCRQRLGPVG